MNIPGVKTYRKKTLTRAIQFTGDNGDDVAAFCEADGIQPWGFLDKDSLYGTVKILPSELVRLEGRAAVYDYIHGAWIPFEVGDFIAAGPKSENYPINAEVMAQTYNEVTE